jgi:hypothetical protein
LDEHNKAGLSFGSYNADAPEPCARTGAEHIALDERGGAPKRRQRSDAASASFEAVDFGSAVRFSVADAFFVELIDIEPGRIFSPAAEASFELRFFIFRLE